MKSSLSNVRKLRWRCQDREDASAATTRAIDAAREAVDKIKRKSRMAAG